jgi:SP family general alpha glucoside:H+ symporter-like MFS transporter
MELEHNKRNQQKARWRELFRGTDLRRTEIACITFIIQNANGVIFAGNTVYVFEQVSCAHSPLGKSGIWLKLQAGISQHVAFSLGFGNSALQLCMNFVNFALIYYLGRRTIMLMGFTLMDITLVMIGVVAVLGDGGNTDARWAQAGLQLVSLVANTVMRSDG